jgi:hypothetical protein
MKTLACVGQTLHGGEWSFALPNRFTPELIDPGTGGWVGIRVCLDSVEKRKILASTESRIPIPRSYSP